MPQHTIFKHALLQHIALVLLLLAGAMVSSTAAAATVVLFLPAQQGMEWILTEHQGAAGFRSGASCQKCHGGDEQAVSSQPVINLETNVAVAGDNLQLDLVWTGGPSAILSVMFDPGNARAFARAGCWAACHSDIRGLQGTQEKYLGQTRLHMTPAGGGAGTKDAATIDAMQADNNFIGIVQLELQDGALLNAKSGAIVATKTLATADAGNSAKWEAGQWHATILLPLPPANTTLDFALVENDAATGKATRHYVSLPHELLKTATGYGFKVE